MGSPLKDCDPSVRISFSNFGNFGKFYTHVCNPGLPQGTRYECYSWSSHSEDISKPWKLHKKYRFLINGPGICLLIFLQNTSLLGAKNHTCSWPVLTFIICFHGEEGAVGSRACQVHLITRLLRTDLELALSAIRPAWNKQTDNKHISPHLQRQWGMCTLHQLSPLDFLAKTSSLLAQEWHWRYIHSSTYSYSSTHAHLYTKHTHTHIHRHTILSHSPANLFSVFLIGPH